ncbi:thyroid hormone receptor-associated protein 3 isoform X2 [Xiphophorus couchianus]|uniref:thyroid hormone receptor-associated protein 3 isoform X2 n=1 Tax=Xiphophorus couchianus TaxID=32473 RepID=UPI0010164CF0|nr:thyroid hormone receptor-associated protein 3-like isoform X2 [Xiphophorus couchianus]
MTKHAGSRSRSRSHSPFHNREKKYPRAYQNNREFRGYHRGFRRPYNFRGRGRGHFNRGRYHRGGGGYNNNNFRPYWKNFKQYPQKQQQYQQQQQQQHQQQQQYNHSRGRSHNVQKRSGSPPQGHSQQSDRSSSPLSRHSQHSSSSSHSSSPKRRAASLLNNQNTKDVKEKHLASKEVQKGGGGDDEPVEHVGLLAGDAREGAGCGKAERTWQSLTDCSSPKRSSPLFNTEANVGQSNQTVNQPSPIKITNDTRNGSPMTEVASGSSTVRKASNEGLNPMLSSFDFFTTEEYLDGDKTALSIAFKKFLEEHTKKSKSAWENGKVKEASDVDNEKGKSNGKASVVSSDSFPKQRKEDTDREMSLRSFLKASPFLSAELEDEDDDIIIRPPLKSLQKEWQNGDEASKPKSKASHSAQKFFEKWQNAACAEFGQTEVDAMVREMYLSGKLDKSEATAAALGKCEPARDFKDLSSEMSFKIRKTAKSPSFQCPETPLSQNSDRELFLVRGEDKPLILRKQEPKCNVRMDFLRDDPISSSDILAEERQLSQDLVQSSKKHQEFRSIFQHVQATQSQRSPSELFAQHIVTIVHHIKAQHFPSSGMTLNERFTLYQRQAAEKEMMKPRKSPEIHRRIDVSPSAFKKHPQLFEAMKSSEDGTYKDGGEKLKGDPMDLRLDIERRKKYSMHDRVTGDSQDFGQEKSEENCSKYQKTSKKSVRKRSRSSSSSSSSSSNCQNDEDLIHGNLESKDEIFSKAQLGQREPPGTMEVARAQDEFKIQIQRRNWNKSSHQGNSSHSDQVNMAINTKNEDWNSKFSPKSKTYFMHDKRGNEATWVENQEQGRGTVPPGRTRFIIRKPTGNACTISARWAVNKEADQDHKVEEINGQS